LLRNLGARAAVYEAYSLTGAAAERLDESSPYRPASSTAHSLHVMVDTLTLRQIVAAGLHG
jgi:uncharacterized membrane protein required for colicin V production